MLTRRRFVIGALSTGAWACSRSAVVRSRPPRITHGVQSGDVQPVGPTPSDANRGDTGAMLGAEQARWFVDAVAGSRARWKIIACDQPVGLVIGDGPDDSRNEGWANGDGPPLGRERELAGILAALGEHPRPASRTCRRGTACRASVRSTSPRTRSRWRCAASTAGSAIASSCRTCDPGVRRPRNRARRGRLSRWVLIRTCGIRYTRSARMASRPCS